MKKKSLFTFILMALTTVCFAQQQEKLPAFPGAEGFGRYVTGGRGGKVIHVKNLNDNGTFSLRWALAQQGAKTIVFDISGTIHLESELSIPSNTTIAGQTAPGDGICVADYPCNIKGNNVIVRYMRFRLGNKNVKNDGADGWDGFGGFDHQDWMIDHCSVSWSIDECLSVLGNKNTTVQWCLISQSLVDAGHSKGNHGYGGNWGGSGASFHHNLIAHHSSRTPRLGPRPTTQLDERMDMRNNVIYNWGGNGCYGGEGMNVNIVNNYYKPGPATLQRNENVQKRIAAIGCRTNEYIKTYPDYAPALHLWGKLYVAGNVNSKWTDVTNDNWTIGIIRQVDASGNDGTFTKTTQDTIKLTEPINFITTTTHTAQKAYEQVLAYAGASLHRDSHDELMINDTRNGRATYTGKGNAPGHINSQDDNKPSGASSDWNAWPTLNSTEAPVDTDKDGIPDEWEKQHGLNPNNIDDGKMIGEGGYTNLEIYLNSLVADITDKQNEGGTAMGSIIEEDGNSVAEYDISQQTSNGDWTFVGGFKFDQTGEPATGKDGTIKYSRNKKYTITLPDGLSVDKVTFYGYCNSDGATGYLGELAGNTYGVNEYVFPARDAATNRATHTITLPSAVTGKLSFTPKGDAQCCYKITLYTTLTTSIESTTNMQRSNTTIYNLAGQQVGKNYKGIVVKNGRKYIVR
ncbi:MAG: pectate lyase [Prevotella sp.]|nr:pectate lyase [Prevotella sp.]